MTSENITMNAMLISLLESYEIFLTLMTVSYQHLHSSTPTFFKGLSISHFRLAYVVLSPKLLDMVTNQSCHTCKPFTA